VIKGHFHYDYKGDGATLECRVGAILSGSNEITWGEWLSNNSVTVRNSPLWKTNPRQQLGYLQVKNWARSFYPGALLGVYTPDELFDDVGAEYDSIKSVDLSTPEHEALAIIDEINATGSIDQLQLLKSKADLVKGEIRKRVLEAYKAKRKALTASNQEQAAPAQEPDQPKAEALPDEEPATIEIDNAVIVDEELNAIDQDTGEILDGYTDLRLAISECATLSDLARILKSMPPQAKADLKAELSAQQVKINEAKK
jgi:flagellar motility protein MotE (MotC chaperone)